MKTIIQISVLLTALFFAGGLLAQTAKIEVAENVMNLGELKQGDPAMYDLVVRNTGDGPLIIANVKTSCGCDVASYPKEPIMAGDSIIIRYKYDSKRLGPINKSMTIQSNDPEQTYVVVRSKGNVTRRLEQKESISPVK